MEVQLTKLIKQAISPGPNRNQAEKDLMDFFNIQPTLYISTLCDIFNTNEADVSFTAGILMRNIIFYAFNTQAWLKANISHKVKERCMNQLSEDRNGKIAADILAGVYVLEITTNGYVDYYSTMQEKIRAGNLLGQNAVYSITQSTKRLKGSADIKIINELMFTAMNLEKPYIITALVCLNEIQDIIKNAIRNSSNKWIQVLIELCNRDKDIASLAIQNITTFITYGLDTIINQIDGLNMFIIKQFEKEDEVAVQAIDYFSCISELETNNRSLNILERVPGLIASLFNKLKKDKTYDEFSWCSYKASSSCLQNMSHSFDIIADPSIRNLLANKLTSGSIIEQEEGIIALGSCISSNFIFETAYNQNTHIETNFLFIKNMVKHIINLLDVPEIREVTLFTLSKLCKANLFCIEIEDLNNLIDKNSFLLLSNIDDSINGVWLILSIAEFSLQEKERNDMNRLVCSIYPKLIQPLIDIVDQKLQNLDPQYQIAIFLTLRTIIKLCPDFYKRFLGDNMWPFILRHLDITFSNASKSSTSEIFEIEDILCGFMYVIYEIHIKLQSKEGEAIIRKVFSSFLQTSFSAFVLEEVYRCLSALCSNKSSFITHINEFMPYIFRDLNHSDRNVILALITLIGDIVGSLQMGFLPYSNQIVHILLNLIKRPDLPTDIKPQIVLLFADIVLGLGNNSEQYFDVFYNIIEQAALFERDVDPVFVDSLRKASFILLESFFYSISESKILSYKQNEIINIFTKVCTEDITKTCVRVAICLSGEIVLRFNLNKEHWIHNFVNAYLKDPDYQDIVWEVYEMINDTNRLQD